MSEWINKPNKPGVWAESLDGKVWASDWSAREISETDLYCNRGARYMFLSPLPDPPDTETEMDYSVIVAKIKDVVRDYRDDQDVPPNDSMRKVAEILGVKL